MTHSALRRHVLNSRRRNDWNPSWQTKRWRMRNFFLDPLKQCNIKTCKKHTSITLIYTPIRVKMTGKNLPDCENRCRRDVYVPLGERTQSLHVCSDKKQRNIFHEVFAARHSNFFQTWICHHFLFFIFLKIFYYKKLFLKIKIFFEWKITGSRVTRGTTIELNSNRFWTWRFCGIHDIIPNNSTERQWTSNNFAVKVISFHPSAHF